MFSYDIKLLKIAASAVLHFHLPCQIMTCTVPGTETIPLTKFRKDPYPIQQNYILVFVTLLDERERGDGSLSHVTSLYQL